MAARQHDERSRQARAHRDRRARARAALPHVVAGGAPGRRRARLQPVRPARASPGNCTAPASSPRSVRSGIVLYPIVGAAARRCFPDRLDIAAAAWAHPGRRRRHGDARRPAHRAGAIPGTARSRSPARSRSSSAAALAGASLAWWCRPNVAPQPKLWFSIAGAARRGARRRARRNHAHQARRQHLGSGLGRGRAVGAVARSRRISVGRRFAAGRSASSCRCRERRRRVAGLSRRAR